MPTPEEIGQRLRELRGETPRENVAKACNVSVSALSMYENGSRIPRDEMRARYDNLEKLTGERYPRGSPRHIEFLEYVIRKRNERIDELEKRGQ